MEVVWKAVVVIPNHRFTASITYHNYLHGLEKGRGTGTTTLQGQSATAGCGLEGVGATCNITGTVQGIQFLGQVQVHGHPGGIWRGSQGPPPPLQVLGSDIYGGPGKRVLLRTLPQREKRHTG